MKLFTRKLNEEKESFCVLGKGMGMGKEMNYARCLINCLFWLRQSHGVFHQR